MNFGELNTRCSIQFKSVTLDATYGAEVITWTLLRSAWCNVQDVLPSRAEQTTGNIVTSKNQARWRIRYSTDVDSTMRVIINRPNPTIYQIISGPAILGDKDRIEFMIEEVSTVV